MGIIYEKTETEEKTVFRFKHLPAAFIVFLILVFIVFAPRIGLFGDSASLTIIFVVFFAVFGIAMVDFRLAISQINQAKREGKAISQSGSKFSFSNPYTVEVSKK